MPAFPSPQHQPRPIMTGYDTGIQASQPPPDSRYAPFPQAQHPTMRNTPGSSSQLPPRTLSSPAQTSPSRSMSSFFRRTASHQNAPSPSPNPHPQTRPVVGRPRPASGVYGMPVTNRPPLPAQPSSAPAQHTQMPAMPPQQPYFLQGSSAADHSSPSQAHRTDDCPGCRADFEAALKASEESAREESRRREQMSREEEEHWRALRASEEEQQRQQREEEEHMRLVMEASRKDEEEAQQRRRQKQSEEEAHRQILLEESRQSALREDEERVRREHADLLERSRLESEERERRRGEEERRMRESEAAAIEASRREMEEEWNRRDEEEHAMEEFSRQGGKQGEAAYWQHLRNDQAYGLALEMNRSVSLSNEGTSASRPSRRPLPPTPGMAALAAGVESSTTEDTNEPDWEQSDDDVGSDSEDPFGDEAEAPPSYDEVRTDRPPEAPASIPGHIQFAPPPELTTPAHSNTLQLPAQRQEKTPISPNSTPRPPHRELPPAVEQCGPPPSASASLATPPAAAVVVHMSESARLPGSGVEEAASSPVSLGRTLSHSSDQGDRQSTEDESRRSSVSTVASGEASNSRASLLQQRAMKGTDFGYCNEPFSPRLTVDAQDGKKHFPPVVQLRHTHVDGSLSQPHSFFVIRAPSWKMLLRALAWYGNTRVEGGPEEVADAQGSLKLRVDVEFVTPTKAEMGSSRPNGSSDAWKSAHVAACMSLINPATSQNSSSALSTNLKQSSRSLDATYVRRGSARRVITLPSHAPVLPLAMVRLAQHLHQAHVFSAACPSTSHTALHSPRDLTRAIDRHDVSYLAKMQRRRRDADGQDVHVGGVASTGRPEDVGQHNDGALDAGAVEEYGDVEGESSTMSRMRDRVRRKLAKRSGESSAVDQDLESWITPFDVNQHG